jgi:hypothetical protein
MGTRSVEANQGITSTIAHALTGIVHHLPPEKVALEKEPVISKESMQNSSLDPSRFFQERIILERQRKDDGLSPP